VQREKDRGRQEDDEPSKAIWKISNEKTPKDNAHLNKKLVEEQQPPDSPAQGIDRRKYRSGRTTTEEERVGGVGTGKGQETRRGEERFFFTTSTTFPSRALASLQ
jgi:hypothetical protein